jgi:hypothetical protein
MAERFYKYQVQWKCSACGLLVLVEPVKLLSRYHASSEKGAWSIFNGGKTKFFTHKCFDSQAQYGCVRIAGVNYQGEVDVHGETETPVADQTKEESHS